MGKACISAFTRCCHVELGQICRIKNDKMHKVAYGRETFTVGRQASNTGICPTFGIFGWSTMFRFHSRLW